MKNRFNSVNSFLFAILVSILLLSCSFEEDCSDFGSVKPSSPTVTTNSSRQAHLLWKPITHSTKEIDGYRIYRNGTEIATTVGVRYTDSGLASATKYCYSVAAFDVSGNRSEKSPESCIVTEAGIVSVASNFFGLFAVREDGTVSGWGRSHASMHQYADIKNIASGSVNLNKFTLNIIVVKLDGTVWTFPNADYIDQRDNGLSTISISPTDMSLTPLSGIDNVQSVVTYLDGKYSIALKSDGTAWIWGNYDLQQMTEGYDTSNHVPVQISGIDGIVQIKTSGNNVFALKSDGTVWTWGIWAVCGGKAPFQ
ncbi:MAG: hypothetical protein HZA20_05760 [Nitrospirae bacterium]|nr:hypothetical protein [Nitrospirota bacterium]